MLSVTPETTADRASQRPIKDDLLAPQGEKHVMHSATQKSEHRSVGPDRVAYIMKGFPRRSEPFVSNEVMLLEDLGIQIDIFAVKGLSESRDYFPVNQIQAPITYVPEELTVEDATFIRWLRFNLPRFIGSHLSVLRQRPWSYIVTLCYALFLSMRCRDYAGSECRRRLPKTTFYKDFLRAGVVAKHILDNGRIRHLHGHFCHGSTTMCMFVSRMCDLSYSFTAHAKDIYLGKLNPGDLLQRKIQQAKFVVTCTEANRAHLQSVGPASTPIHTIYHGLDPSRFQPCGERCENATKSESRPQILSVGRFVEKKGFPYLVQACHHLRQRGVTFHCRLVGSPDVDSEVVAELIQDYDLDHYITVDGAKSQEQLSELYRDADLFVLPCIVADNGDRDGIPNVLAEAMSTALPVVSTRVSGIPELVRDRDTGMLVPPRDPVALADAIEEVLGNPTLRGRLGRQARAEVCRVFDSSRTTVSLAELFADVLDLQLAANGPVTPTRPPRRLSVGGAVTSGER